MTRIDADVTLVDADVTRVDADVTRVDADVTRVRSMRASVRVRVRSSSGRGRVRGWDDRYQHAALRVVMRKAGRRVACWYLSPRKKPVLRIFSILTCRAMLDPPYFCALMNSLSISKKKKCSRGFEPGLANFGCCAWAGR